MIFSSTIAGIPCKIEVIWFKPAVPMRITGSGFGDADPPEDQEFDFEVLDKHCRPAPWLANKCTKADEARIEEEYLIMRRAEEYADAEA